MPPIGPAKSQWSSNRSFSGWGQVTGGFFGGIVVFLNFDNDLGVDLISMDEMGD